MALTAASLRLRKRGRRFGASASAHEKEEGAQHRVTRCARGRVSQVPIGSSSIHLSRRPSRSSYSSSSSRSRSRSFKRRNHSTSIRRSTRKVHGSRKCAAAGEVATDSGRHHGEDWKKTEGRGLRGSATTIEFNSSYTSSTRSSSITPINFVDMAYGSSSSSSREEALANTCRDETPGSSTSSSGGASPSTCTDRSSGSSLESPGRSSRCSGREDEDDQPACNVSASRLHHENHSAALHVEDAATHAAAAGPLMCPPPLYGVACPASAQDGDASHIVNAIHSHRSGAEFGERSVNGNTTTTEGEGAAAADGEARISSSSRFTGRLPRKRAAAAAAMGRGHPVSSQMPCRTSGRRRRTAAAAAAARGEDSCWVYQEAASSYSRGSRRTRGTAAVAAGVLECRGEVTGTDAGLRYNNSSAGEKHMTMATAEPAAETAATCSSAYECLVSSSSDLLCSTRERGQGKVPRGTRAAEKRRAAAMPSSGEVGGLLSNEDSSLVERYAGSAAAAAMHLFMRRSAPATTGSVNPHEIAPSASSYQVKHEGSVSTCIRRGKLTDRFGAAAAGAVAAGAEGFGASALLDSSCCGAGESDAGGTAASSASQLLQYAGLGHTCTSSRTVSSEVELLQYGDALPQPGNGMSGSPSAAIVSNAQSNRNMCGVGSNHTRSPADNGCTSSNVLLSHSWNRSNSLSFSSSHSLPLGSNTSGNNTCGPCLDGRRGVASQSIGIPPSMGSNNPSMPHSSRNSHMSSSSSERCASTTTVSPPTRTSSTCGIIGGVGMPPAGGNNGSADLLMRPGVSYYGGRQAWVAEIKYGGRRRFKVFSVAKYGYEGAKQMAAATREQWEAAREAGQLDQLMRSSQRHQCPVQSGVKGVYYDTARKGWRVVVTLNCRQMSKFFLASKFGNAEAKRLAIECRQMWLDAIRNGRAGDVFEKARRLVSFKMKTNPPQLAPHPKLLSISPLQKPVPSPSQSPSSLTHPCSNAATIPAAAFSSTATNGLPPSSHSNANLPGGGTLSHVAGAATNNVTLSQGTTAAATTGTSTHVLLPPLVAAAAAAARVASSVPGIHNAISPFRSNGASAFLLKSPAARAETASSSRGHGKARDAEEPLFPDAAAAAARLGAAVAGVPAIQAQAHSPAAVEAAVGFGDGCTSGGTAGGMITAAAGMSSLNMMIQDDCAPMHSPAAGQKAVSAETAVQQASVSHTTWLRGSRNRSNVNAYETANQQQQHPSVLAHPLPTSCNGLMLSNSASTASSISGTGSLPGSASSNSTSRRESAHVSTCCSPDSSALPSFVACVRETTCPHGPREGTHQDSHTSHHQSNQAARAEIPCLAATALAVAAAQGSSENQKASGEMQEAASGIEGTTTSATTAVSEEGLADGSQMPQQFDCGAAAGDEAEGLVTNIYATSIPGFHTSPMQQQQNQVDATLGHKTGNASGVRSAVLSQPLATTQEEGPLMQQKQWDDAIRADGGSAATTAGPSPAVRVAGEVKAESITAVAGHRLSIGSAEGRERQGASEQSAASTATAVEGSAGRGGGLATADGRTTSEVGMKRSEGLRHNPGSGAPSGTPASSQSGALPSHEVQAAISSNRYLQQHLHLQLLQDLRGSSFPLLDALWPSAAGSAPLAGCLAPNTATDLALRGRVTGFSNCSTGVAAGKGQGEGGTMLLPSGCLSGRNSYETQNFPCGAGGFATPDKADAVIMAHNSLPAVASADKGSTGCGELPRGASVLSLLLQQPRAQLSLPQQQQFFAAAGAAASASQSCAALSTADNGDGGQNRTSSSTQTACDGAAAPATTSQEVCCKFPGGLAIAAAAAAALQPSSSWLLGPTQRSFVPGAAGAAPPSTTAAGVEARRFLSGIGNTSYRAPWGGGNNIRRRGGGGTGGAVVAAAAAGAAPFSMQNRQPQIFQNATAAASPTVGAATSRGRLLQQRQSKDGTGVTVTAAATATGESSSTCDVRGVYLDTRNNAWAATMGVHGRNVKKSFAVAKHGYETALQLAIHARRQLERIYWGENAPGTHSSSTSPTPPQNSPSQPSSCLPITPVPTPPAASAAASVAAGTEGDEVDTHACFAAASPSNTTPSAAPAVQLQRLQQQQQRLQQQFHQQLAAAGVPPLSAAPSPTSLNIFGPRPDAALGPAGFAAAVMGGTSAAAAAGLVSAAAANLQQQLRCAAALQQHQAHNAGAPTRGGLPPTEQQLCDWNGSPLKGAVEEKGFYNNAVCRSTDIAAAGGLGNILGNPANSLETDGMLVAQPTNRDGSTAVNNTAGPPDTGGAPVARGGRGEVGRATAEAGEHLAAASAIVYPSLSTATSAAPAPDSPSYRGCDSSSGAAVDESREIAHGGQDGNKSSAAVRLLSGIGGPNSCTNGAAVTGDISAASVLLGSVPAGGRSNAGGASGLLLGAVHGLAAAGGYAGAAGNMRGLSPTLLLNEYGVGGIQPGLLGGRGLEAGGATAAGAAAASFLAGAGGMLLGAGRGIASFLCGGRGTAPAGETAAGATSTEGPAGENNFMMQDALTALLLQLDPRQRNDMLRGCAPPALLAAAGAAAGAAAAASREENSTSTMLPVLLQPQNMHNNVPSLYGPPHQRVVATGSSAGGLHLEQHQQAHYERSEQEHAFQQHAHQRQHLQQQSSGRQQQRMEDTREDLHDDNTGPGRPTNGAEQHRRTVSLDGRDAEGSTSMIPCDHPDQHTGFGDAAVPTEDAISLYVNTEQKELWRSHQEPSLVGGDVKAEVFPQQQQQDVGGGCVSVAGRAEGLSAGTGGTMNITDTQGCTTNSGNSSRNSFSSGMASAGCSNLSATGAPNTLNMRQEAAGNRGQTCSVTRQPCASESHGEGKMRTGKGDENNNSYPWTGGVTLLETGLMLAAAGAGPKEQHRQQQRPTVSNTYPDNDHVASCAPLLAEDSRRT